MEVGRRIMINNAMLYDRQVRKRILLVITIPSVVKYFDWMRFCVEHVLVQYVNLRVRVKQQID